MRLTIILLISLASVDAGVTFAKSEVLDNDDLKGVNAVASFRCSAGCRVFSPTQSDTIAIFEGANIKKSLRDLSATTKGAELPGGTYQLKNTGLADQPFVFFAVERGAANYDSPVHYVTSTIPLALDITAAGPHTILSSSGSINFMLFSNFDKDSLPSVYAAGFDSIGSCKPVFKPKSLVTLAHTAFPVNSPIATINFNKAGGTLGVSGETSQSDIGEDSSAVFVSPGYVGCPAIPSVGDSLYTLLPRVTGIEQHAMASNSNGLSLSISGHYNIAKESDAIALTVNGQTKKLYGKNSIADKSDN
ncbi:hypothetical protein PMAYCL1PPCAC_00920, partial [Pristionchus mayeri]